jgi:hypothetical protein
VFGKLAARKLHHEAHEGYETKGLCSIFPSFVIFVLFVVSYSAALVAALPR